MTAFSRFLLLALLATAVRGQTIVVPLGNAKLTTALNVNAQTLNQAQTLNFGTTNDVSLTRSGNAALTLTGSLTISGAVVFGGMSTPGLLAQTTAGVYQARTLTAGSANLVITNGSGVAGNPTLDLGSAVVTATSTHTLSNKTFDAAVASTADLAAIATTSLAVPAVKIWVNTGNITAQIWLLKTGTDATEAGVVQRPNDYNGTTNQKVWYRAGL